ncbi:hypothetical protein Ccrd_011288 [Cynara cardunculus var. scolymus]|uniref:Protein kinase domain-containing protein n=1 Tax=Cynara cardunculus var. scolymus TaxID=59895 RepID=A0A103YJQ1_CYNCS|nr:hypothetical protein Ccrd_011288 [Cynara cardunculus var. scolymus]
MNWKKGPVIGCGSSATVSLATSASGDLFAVKSTQLSTSHFLQKEQQFLSRLRSPHIIEYIGFDVDYDDNIPMYNLFMEYASGGTISDLHSNNLVHCDIKCDNLLVTGDGVKIGDLGCAKLAAANGGVTSSAFSGTPVFMAPEVARGEEQGFGADVWALGCAVIEMATGCNPWPEMENPVSGLYRIGFSGDVPLFPVWLSVEGKDFLEKCLRANGEERWTAKELLRHPFVNSNSGFQKVEAFTKNSPTAILDQGFWDSLETSDSSPAATQFMNFSGESPVDRIRQLVEGTGTSSCLPNWVEEDDWITVRINDIDESSRISEHDLYIDLFDVVDDESESTRTDSFWFSDLYVEDELSSSVRMMSGSDYDMGVSRFLEFKNMNNDISFLIDSNLTFVLLDDSYSFKSFLNGNVSKWEQISSS